MAHLPSGNNNKQFVLPNIHSITFTYFKEVMITIYELILKIRCFIFDY